MRSTVKMTALALLGTAACWFAASAPAGSAAPLSQVEILKVLSSSCRLEDVSDGRERTQCDHSGPGIKVYVLEIGYGREPYVTLDGFEVDGTRTPVCEDGSSYEPCAPGGITAGYLYIFDLADKKEGTFRFSNTSINAPGNSMSAEIYIK
ncbi:MULTISPECIES: DUF4879 domain-containing protein [unclassified Pseudomonas]|uniref:DUF4879 domain-containing protein n=1 Tax=unclassified Pseudomonas TaxID=196821 RepID=UPI000CD11C92|nr:MULTISPECIES: DUF4879 domain-containing protein [unclassified Pseudomonas]POA51906.1 DUF4879 domain-containing protein [Pseudomonas sp. FW507-12TSA]